ncbi:hypothetical protein D6764_01745 [Candidatus Woesearchaeota archaeon]|nr:MAG: hypothetical protein D6764_01745 [Candidatus Woesearchaeota archaeon]
MAKKKKTHSHTEHEKEEPKEENKTTTIKETAGKAWQTITKAWNRATSYRLIILIAIPMLLSIFLRAQPLYLPITDDWAQRNVESYYKNQISQQINQLYPNLPDANKNALIESEFIKVKQQQAQEIQQQAKDLSKEFKSRFQDESGQTYLLAIDPYLFYRHARNYVRYGRPGEVVVDGVVYDALRNGRLMRAQPPTFHPWVMSKLHKVISIFKPGISVMGSVFYFPIIVCTLAVIPAFFLARKIGGDFGGFVAAVITAIHPAVLGRTAGGFSDTDSYNLFLPLLITWLFVEAIDRKDVKKSALLAGVSAFFVGIYQLAWGGWWYVYDFILAAAIGYLIILTINKRSWKKLKDEFKKGSTLKSITVATGVFIAATNIFILLFRTMYSGNTFAYSLQYLVHFITQPLGFTQYKAVAVKDIWPNVLTTVAELNLASADKVMKQMGGNLFYLLTATSLAVVIFARGKEHGKVFKYGLASAAWILLVMWMRNHLHWMLLLAFTVLPAFAVLVLESRENVKTEAKYMLILAVWFAATFYAAMRGIRFSALIVPGLSVALGSGLGVMYNAAANQMEKSLELKKSIGKIVMGALILFLLVNPIRGAYNTAKTEIPSMNDGWYNLLQDIKKDDTDGIITSWWDFGHWFTAIAERRVTFDGGNQGRRIHWVGKTLLENDEEEAVAILRMLNCGQDTGPNLAEKYLGDQLKAYNTIIDNLKKSREEAKIGYIESGMTEEQAEKVLNLTHCTDMLPQYYIASDDMIGKSGVWAHFGIWNFTRGAMWHDVHDESIAEGIKILKEKYGLDDSTAEQYYYEISTTDADKWVSPWPSYASSIGRCNIQDKEIICNNGLKVNTEKGTAEVSTQQGTGSPVSLVYLDGEGVFREKTFKKPIIPYSAALFSKEGRTYSIFMHPKLAKSMFTRMFFFEGKGLKYFTPLSHRKQVTGGDLYAYKVDWEKYLNRGLAEESQTAREDEQKE